ncbi:TonB-dependent siderophore receptor [Nitrospira sp. M1]
MRQKKVKQLRRAHRRQAMLDRLNQLVDATAGSVKGSHRQNLLWGFLVGLSSVALGGYHPALAQDWQETGPMPGRDVAADPHSGAVRLVAEQDRPIASTQSFDIPEGNLSTALKAYARLVDWQLLYSSDLVAGRHTKGLQGTYSKQEALRRLLTGTGVTYRFSDANTVTLIAQEDAGAAGIAGAAAGVPSGSDIPVVQVQPIEVTDTITRNKAFLPPVDGYKADETISSTRTALPINETPTSIGVVTRDVIRDTFSLSQRSALEHVSGVSNGGIRPNRSESFQIRGFSDGVENFSVLRSNGLPTDTFFAPDPALIERYEIIKGPASIAGGASSPGGVVNRITKTPQDANFAISEFQAGSYDFYRGTVDANGVLPQHPNVRGRLIFAVEEGGNFIDNVPVRQYMVAPSIEMDFFDGAGTLLLTGHYQQFDGAGYGGFPLMQDGSIPDIPRTRNIGGGSENGAELTFRGQDYELHYNHEFVNNLTLSIKGKYEHSDLSDKVIYAYDIGGIPLSGDVTIGDGLRQFDIETFAGEIFLNKEFEAFGHKHELLAGVDHRDQNLDFVIAYSTLGIDNIFNPANNFQVQSKTDLRTSASGNFNPRTTDLRQTGLFSQVVVRPFDALTIVAAGRYDFAQIAQKDTRTNDVNEDKSRKLTGRVGATYELLPGFRVYAGFSQSFQTNAFAVTRNGLLDPETGENYEVGGKVDLLDGRLRVTTALFRNYRQNAETTDPTDGRFSIGIGEQRHQGVEFDVNGQLWSGLNVTGNFTYLDAEITKDTRNGAVGSAPNGVPRYFGGGFVTYELQSGALQGVGFGGGVYFQSPVKLGIPNTISVNGYERVDAVVFYRPPQKAYDFTINVRNLFDTTYLDNVGNNNFNYSNFGAPVSVFGTLRFKFDPTLEWTPPWAD